MERMSGPAFVLLTFVLVTLPAFVLLRVVPNRHPWRLIRVAAWTWITVIGFFGMNYFLRACQGALLP
jgi:uncharacterized BrkB/YihY/UPF0761 family membrane protein